MNPDRLNRLEEVRERFGRFLRIITEFLEILLAIMIMVGITIRFMELPSRFASLLIGERETFKAFLDFIIDSVIGVELIHLLCQPNLDSVVEILLVALTREIIMIEGNPTGTLLYVIALSLVFVLRRFMFVDKLDRHDRDFSLSSLLAHQTHKLKGSLKHEKGDAGKAPAEEAPRH